MLIPIMLHHDLYKNWKSKYKKCENMWIKIIYMVLMQAIMYYVLCIIIIDMDSNIKVINNVIIILNRWNKELGLNAFLSVSVLPIKKWYNFMSYKYNILI